MPDILPSSMLKRPKGSVRRPDGWWQPIFCANCGCDGGLVPEENMTFAFYLCNTCAEKLGDAAHLMMMPDEVFFLKVQEAQLERYGRLLTAEEILKALNDDSHPLAKLAKDRLRSKNLLQGG